MLVGHFQAHEGGPGMLCTSQRCRVQEPARFYQFYHIYLDIFISAFLDILWVPKILYGVVLIMNDLCSQQVTWFQKGQCHRQRLCDSRWRPAEEPWRFPPHMMQSPWWFFLDTVITATCRSMFDIVWCSPCYRKLKQNHENYATWINVVFVIHRVWTSFGVWMRMMMMMMMMMMMILVMIVSFWLTFSKKQFRSGFLQATNCGYSLNVEVMGPWEVHIIVQHVHIIVHATDVWSCMLAVYMSKTITYVNVIYMCIQ